jgi:hypothetical protein
MALKVRYYIDPTTDQPHIYKHDVSESEVEEILEHPVEDRLGSEGSRVALGHTLGARFLRVIYVPDPEPNSIFVITAYEIRGNALLAFRRRRRRKQQ